MAKPLASIYVTSPFGPRATPYSGFHTGIDLRAKEVPFYAIADGVVKGIGVDYLGGNYIKIWHSSLNVFSLGFHLKSTTVPNGSQVKAGQQIAITGNSGHRADGASMPYHLHFGIRKADNTNIDPAPYLSIGETVTRDDVTRLYQAILLRTPSETEIAQWVNQSFDTTLKTFLESPEHSKIAENYAKWAKAIPTLEDQINKLNQTLSDGANHIAKLEDDKITLSDKVKTLEEQGLEYVRETDKKIFKLEDALKTCQNSSTTVPIPKPVPDLPMTIQNALRALWKAIFGK